MSYLDKLPRPFFVLAPMDDVTDTVFRRIIADCAAPDLYFTEFVNADGLQSPGRPKLLKKLSFSPIEQPIIAQIWGKNVDSFYKTAQQIADGTFAKEVGLTDSKTPQSEVTAGFAGVDLNMGCPEKTAVKNGTCSALINDRVLAKALITATREGLAGRLPLSVKTRLGYNDIDMAWIEFLLTQNLDMLTIHGRTRKEMSSVPANWQQIGQIRELRDKLAPGTLIVGNGDVTNRKQGQKLAEMYGLDGVMIGRGIFHDPYAFATRSSWSNATASDRKAVYRSHVEAFAATWQNGERPIHTLNKFCKMYIQGFDGAKELRKELMFANSTSELLQIMS